MTCGIGTYAWMSPEIINGNSYTEKADIYAYGIVLWEILTRKIPYKGKMKCIFLYFKGMDQLRVAIDVVNKDLRPKIPDNCKP